MSILKGSSIGGFVLPMEALPGKAVKIITANNPAPFYFKITGYNLEPKALVGSNEEGQEMEILTSNIDFILID